MEQPIWNFEQEPYLGLHDESSVNLRAYFDRMDDAKLEQYREDWSDEQLMEWDGNFKDDGALMLICSERDIDVEEYRQELEGSRAYRQSIALK